MNVIVISGTAPDSLLSLTNGQNDVLEFSRWVCDSIAGRLLLRDAYGKPIIDMKITTEKPITVDTVEYTDSASARLAIGANW